MSKSAKPIENSRDHTADLIEAWARSPRPSTKISSYFAVYAQLFGALRGEPITFVETGVLGGGSLFMWREWFGPRARIVGVDMNPAARKLEDHGFEIIIGDQGDPHFWSKTFKSLGEVDIFLDDGGHQSFQQIVTVEAALRHVSRKGIVVVEDTHSSFMQDFSDHGKHSFHEYAKACSDFLTMRMSRAYPNRIYDSPNEDVKEILRNVWGIQFYSGMVIFQIDSGRASEKPEILWNAPKPVEKDFRFAGKSSAVVQWPTLYEGNAVEIRGKRN
jgi:hypothetical protein